MLPKHELLRMPVAQIGLADITKLAGPKFLASPLLN